MKKLSGLIVSKRIPLLIVALILTAVCALGALKVEVNSDMTKYLPDDFSMKIGMDIMNEEFPAMDASQTIRVMATGLDEAQRKELREKLEDIEYVSSVTHEENSDYHKGDNTLYIINTTYAYGSNEELSIERALDFNFTDYNIVYKNDEMIQSTVPMWVMGLAVALVLIILFAMCGSWFEPVLFLATIGIAIGINAGTNLILGSVSNVTQSISAILQMVLSMDYSIILMNRYRQEKAVLGNKEDAMKAALKSAFSSVASSAFTTVVGLLMLVFMQFKIGFDIGVVLAKGIFISMLCVFTVLPGLIVIFDKLIEKTTKKELHVPMGAVARFSNKMRYVLSAAFAVMFVGFYILQGYTQIAYSLEMKDPVAEVFPTTNMLVAIYDNEDEEVIAALADELEKDEHVQMVMGYPNMLGKRHTAGDMVDSIMGLSNSFGISMDVGLELNEELLKIVYYDKFDGKAAPVSMGEFLTFLSEDVMENKMFKSYISDEMRESAGALELFKSKSSLTQKRSAKELSDFFGIEEELIKSLMVYYFGINGGVDFGKMSLPQFGDYVVNEVAVNEMYASMFDEETMAQIDMLTTFTDKEEILKLRGIDEMAAVLGTEPEQMRSLYFVYTDENQENYLPNLDANRQLNLLQVISYVVSNSENFSSMMSEADLERLPMALKLIEGTLAEKKYSPEELASVVGMDSTQLKQLYLLYISQHGNSSRWQMSLKQMLDFVSSDVMNNPDFAGMLDSSMAAQVGGAKAMADAVISGSKLDASQLSSLLVPLAGEGMLDENMIELSLVYYASTTDAYSDEWMLNIEELFGHLANSMVNDPRYSALIGEEIKGKLGEMEGSLAMGVEMLKSDKYSRMVFQTVFPAESEETTAFITRINEVCKEKAKNEVYLIGTSAMNYEMSQTFDDELALITLLTSLAIFVIVALTFKSVIIPLILVLLVQCGVYITITVIGLQGFSIYFLALLIVECILMGATIDYGILFTNYYIENRQTMDKKNALVATYKGSIHTVMTSGLIMVAVTAVISVLYDEPTIAQICRTISIGVLSAVLLILFVLPGLLAACDRFIIKKKKNRKNKSKES